MKARDRNLPQGCQPGLCCQSAWLWLLSLASVSVDPGSQCILAAHVGDLDCMPTCWTQSHPVLVYVDIWNMSFLYPSLFSSLWFHLKFNKKMTARVRGLVLVVSFGEVPVLPDYIRTLLLGGRWSIPSDRVHAAQATQLKLL